jgi:hypothetical protein
MNVKIEIEIEIVEVNELGLDPVVVVVGIEVTVKTVIHVIAMTAVPVGVVAGWPQYKKDPFPNVGLEFRTFVPAAAAVVGQGRYYNLPAIDDLKLHSWVADVAAAVQLDGLDGLVDPVGPPFAECLQE